MWFQGNHHVSFVVLKTASYDHIRITPKDQLDALSQLLFQTQPPPTESKYSGTHPPFHPRLGVSKSRLRRPGPDRADPESASREAFNAHSKPHAVFPRAPRFGLECASKENGIKELIFTEREVFAWVMSFSALHPAWQWSQTPRQATSIR